MLLIWTCNLSICASIQLTIFYMLYYTWHISMSCLITGTIHILEIMTILQSYHEWFGLAISNFHVVFEQNCYKECKMSFLLRSRKGRFSVSIHHLWTPSPQNGSWRLWRESDTTCGELNSFHIPLLTILGLPSFLFWSVILFIYIMAAEIYRWMHWGHWWATLEDG